MLGEFGSLVKIKYVVHEGKLNIRSITCVYYNQIRICICIYTKLMYDIRYTLEFLVYNYWKHS